MLLNFSISFQMEFAFLTLSFLYRHYSSLHSPPQRLLLPRIYVLFPKSLFWQNENIIFATQITQTIPSTLLFQHDFSKNDVEKKTQMNFYFQRMLFGAKWISLSCLDQHRQSQHLHTLSTHKNSIKEVLN